MILCKVTGIVTASTLLPALNGIAFVLVQKEEGGTLVAADTLGARVGNHVVICQGETAQALVGGKCPVDAAVTGIVLQ